MRKINLDSRYKIRRTFEYNKEKGPFVKATNQNNKIKKILGNYGVKTDFFGFKTNLPLGVAAGTLHNLDYLEMAMKDGFEVLTWKTFRSEYRLAHRNDGNYLGHNIVFLPTKKIKEKEIGQERISGLTTREPANKISITNSVGMPSPAPVDWMPMLQTGQKLARKYNKGIITSVVGTAREGDKIEDLARDYAFTARCAESVGEKIIELNLSCPNVSGKEGVIYKDIKASAIIAKITRETLRETDTKILLKLGFATKAHYKKILRACGEYIDGVVAINTISMNIVDKKGRQALPGGLSSGTCGAAIIDLAVKAVERLAEARRELGKSGRQIKIIGCGGVTDPESFRRHIEAGAEFVMCATSALFNPQLPLDIAKYLRKNKIKK
jgi:dihydroorotate dehydrogenase